MSNNLLRVFVPAKDFNVSQEFYSALGFDAEIITQDLCLYSADGCSFFLQRFYNQTLAENLMFQYCVADIDEVYQKAHAIAVNFAHVPVKVSAIEQEHWGKVFYLWGPSGELWHVTELMPAG